MTSQYDRKGCNSYRLVDLKQVVLKSRCSVKIKGETPILRAEIRRETLLNKKDYYHEANCQMWVPAPIRVEHARHAVSVPKVVLLLCHPRPQPDGRVRSEKTKG